MYSDLMPFCTYPSLASMFTFNSSFLYALYGIFFTAQDEKKCLQGFGFSHYDFLYKIFFSHTNDGTVHVREKKEMSIRKLLK